MIKPSAGSFGETNVARLWELVEEDPQLAGLVPDETVRAAACRPGMTFDRVIAAVLTGYARRPALGQRSYDVVAEEATGKIARKYRAAFDTIAYQELHDRLQALAMAWRSHPYCTVRPEEFVCILGFAGVEYTIIDLACAYAKAVAVPLGSGTPETELGEILARVNPVVLATTIQNLPLAVEHALRQSSIKSLLLFDYDARVGEEIALFEQSETRLREMGASTKLNQLGDLIEYGKKQSFSFLPAKKGENERMAMIIHSSGSTGKPKGACIAAKALIHTWQGQPGGQPRVAMFMSPFHHMMGRDELVYTLRVGGTGYFTQNPDMSTLFEDIRLARPTTLTFFPRMLDMIYQEFGLEVSRRLRAGGECRAAVEATVKAEMKNNYLGDRFFFGTTVSAPIAPRIKNFIEDCFEIHLANGYGNTESGGGLAVDGEVDRALVLEYKLKDVPELGYFTTDKPHPRGEFCVKTKFGTTQYYKDPEATAGLLDEEGFIKTGDIVEELAPDRIAIIDRSKDVLKLSQGEFVSTGALGKVFEAGSLLIHQIYLYGNSFRAYLLAVVVPEPEVVRKLSQGEVAEDELKRELLEELRRIGQKEKRKSFEIPRDLIIAREPFSNANGLLSAVGKYLRPEIRARYGPALKRMYEEHERTQQAELLALGDSQKQLSTQEKLLAVLERTLGVKGLVAGEAKTFQELGGDSIAAVIFSMAIERVFGVTLTGDVILSPQGNLQRWLRAIEVWQEQAGTRPNFSTIHCRDTTVLHAQDLSLERFIAEPLLQRARQLPEVSCPPRTVLLTGATGFLGHILCLDWMKTLERVDGKLICLIRASDEAAARERLDRCFKGLDSDLEREYERLAGKYLEVLAGDVSESSLGLSSDNFDRLTREVDRICHAAALVNHRLTYKHLFGPNVAGTAEIIRLGITRKKKPIDFISTLGVRDLLDSRRANNEDTPLRSRVELSDRNAAGYIISKWAGEHLLQRACQESDLCVNVFRCSMILPHRRYRGQFNAEDRLTRLLYSIMLTGIAPKSFYHLDEHGAKRSSHYDGIPVDLLSAAVVAQGNEPSQSRTNYNAYNYLCDEISLDSFIDWMETGGVSLDRIEDHREWYEKIGERLRALSGDKRRHSVLDILDAYQQPFTPDVSPPECSNFKNLSKCLNGGEGLPHLSEAYIHRYTSSIQSRFEEEQP